MISSSLSPLITPTAGAPSPSQVSAGLGNPAKPHPNRLATLPTPGEGWGVPREEAGLAVLPPHQLGPQAQGRFRGLRPSRRTRPRPALSPSSLSVWSPTLEVQTTDKPSHAKWEFNCKQFLWIMGPSVPPYAKGKKKNPH